MNMLSILFYLTSLFHTLKMGAITVFVGSCIGLAISMFLSSVMYAEMGMDEDKDLLERVLKWKSKFKFWVFAAGALAILSPNSSTMYLIMGSEIGEEVMISKEGEKIRRLLNKEIDDILNNGLEPTTTMEFINGKADTIDETID